MKKYFCDEFKHFLHRGGYNPEQWIDTKAVWDEGAFFMFIYDLSNFLTSTAFVSTNAKYGISLSRYTVFLKTVL